MYRSEPIDKLLKAIRLVAYIHFCVAILCVLVTVGLILTADRWVPEVVAWNLGISLLDQLLPAVLLLFFGNRIGHGAVWAAYGIMVLAGLEMTSLLILLMDNHDAISVFVALVVLLPLALLVKLPTLYLAAVCLNALPELRHFRRGRQRAMAVGGFPVIPVKAAPPPMAAARIPPRPGSVVRDRVR